ncbi:MAG: CRISPR-associated endonuclease Cas4g/Cas1g [Planctomycetota bacterium]
MTTSDVSPVGSASPGGADLPDLLPARMLNEFAYCPRLFYLEWVQGEFRDSADTVEGRWRHRNVDRPSGEIPAEPGGSSIHARSVELSSSTHGFIAKMDLVEAEGLRATPVDYKRGKKPEHGPYEPERVQLCVQALILRDKGYACDAGVVYYVESKERVAVPIDDALVARTLDLARQARATAARGAIPPPLVDSPKCPRCSLVGICLPDETNALASAEEPVGTVRRLFPARDDAQPVYVQEQGASVGTSDDRLVLRRNGDKREVRLLDVSQLCVYGNVQVSTQAIRALAKRSTPVCHFSYGGWFEALTTGMGHKNVELRQAQFHAANDAGRSLAIARRIVEAKIRNQRTLLRRNHAAPPKAVIAELARAARSARTARAAETLLGIEGAAARAYFAHFQGMLKGVGGPLEFEFTERNRRPPRDPVNAMLSFVYALLAKDLHVQSHMVGFDSHLGFYHRPRYGRPALALDFAEEFRPIIGDSVVVSAINNGELGPSDFVTRGDATALTAPGRKRLIEAYERRCDTLIRHPVLGYAISYRRVFEVQARLLARHLLREIPAYVPFRTR